MDVLQISLAVGAALTGLAVLIGGILWVFHRATVTASVTSADSPREPATRGEFADLRAEMVGLRAEWATTLEQLESLVLQVDRKRRQAQGAVDRAAQLNGGAAPAEEVPMSREDQLAEARSRMRQRSSGG